MLDGGPFKTTWIYWEIQAQHTIYLESDLRWKKKEKRKEIENKMLEKFSGT